MAIRKNNILGFTFGKLGNTINRIRNGKEVVYTKPAKVRISQSKKAKAFRNKFALTVNLSKFINSISALSNIWNSAVVRGTNSYQKLIKYNSKFTSINSLTIKNVITPPGINFSIDEITYSGNKILLLVNSINTGFPNPKSFARTIYSVLYFYEPKSNKYESLSFLTLSKEIEGELSDTKLEILLTLNKTQQLLSRHYNKCIAYFAIILSSEDTNTPVWSNTVSKLFDLDQSI